MSFRFTENYPEMKAAFSLDFKKTLYSRKSEYQQIDVIETERFGRVLLIDGMVMLTQKDEFIYHEMISHIPLFTHPRPAEILVIGGGDGGTVRELLKHPDAIHIDLVDIDKTVSQVCLKYFPEIASGLLSEKVTCHYEDGVDYVRNYNQKYDIVIIDSTDPINVGEGLFSTKFYQNCHRILNNDGVLINQAESPAFRGRWVKGIAQKLARAFPKVSFYQAHIPTYPSGHWLFAFASKKYDPIKNFRIEKYRELELNLKYYNDEIHKAAFALPNFVRELVEQT